MAEPTTFDCPWCKRHGMTRAGLRDHEVWTHPENFLAHLTSFMRTKAGDQRKPRRVT